MVKRVSLPYIMTSGGRTYFRRGGALIRLPDPDHPDFLAAYDEARRGKPMPAGRTMKALILSYRRSDRWRALSDRTKSDYQKVLDYLMEKAGHVPIASIRREHVIDAMEANAHRARFANYVVQVMSVLFERAIDMGWSKENPAKGVRKLRLGAGWDPWPLSALRAYESKADGYARLIYEMCIGTGQRISDVLEMRWADMEGGGITLRQNKTGAELWIPLTPRLRAVLDATPRLGLTIIAQTNSKPLSYRQASIRVQKAREASGTLGYVIHGWRGNAASELYEAGCSDAEVQAITGHKSVEMARKYGRGARQRRLAKGALDRLESSGEDL